MKCIIPGLLVAVVLASTPCFGLDFAAGEQPFSEPSPDGKWLFEATWFAGSGSVSGYLCDIKDVASGRTAFADAKSGAQEYLPSRMSISWSPDSRYARINYYYSHLVSGDVIVAFAHGKWVEVDLPKPGHPRHMIHPADRGQWVAGSDIQVEVGDWGDHDTITLTDTMEAVFLNARGEKHKITSTRERAVQLTGATARTVSTGTPEYEDSAE